MKMKKLGIKALILGLVFVVSSVNLFAQTRISFARGRTSASIGGQIGGGTDRSFVLRAKYGQYLSANVSSRNGCVKFSSGATTTSYITESGDNFLYLINTCRNPTSFILTVSINYGSD